MSKSQKGKHHETSWTSQKLTTLHEMAVCPQFGWSWTSWFGRRWKCDTFKDRRTHRRTDVQNSLLGFPLWLAKHHLDSYSTLFVPFADTTETTTENKQLSERSPLNPWKNHRETVNWHMKRYEVLSQWDIMENNQSEWTLYEIIILVYNKILWSPYMVKTIYT